MVVRHGIPTLHTNINTEEKGSSLGLVVLDFRAAGPAFGFGFPLMNSIPRKRNGG
jgi:hypothetical protein